MKSFRKELWFNIKTRRDYINITPDVQETINESKIKEGLCLVNAMHISMCVTKLIKRMKKILFKCLIMYESTCITQGIN